MITIYRATNRDMLNKIGVKRDEMAFVSSDNGGEMSGYCKFVVRGDSVVLLDLYERNSDMIIADALVRATANSYRENLKTVTCVDRVGLLPQYQEFSGCFIDGIAKIENVLTGSCI
jgi:hypothetical protein